MEQAVVTLPPDPRAAAQSRRWAASTLEAWALEHISADVVLVTSELVTNAIRHAGADLLVRLVREQDQIRLEVTDPLPELPELRRPDLDSGRGLHIVGAVADRWGVVPIPGVGKRVWAAFELRS
jgi:anti-sigma regulatory factor (Ser/Thr protein kinase)